MRHIVIALVLALSPLCAHAAMWKDLKAGWTVAEVKQHLPEATAPLKPEHLLKDTLKEELEVRGFKVVGLDFVASLFFRDGKLDRIFLQPVEEPLGGAARAAVFAIKQSLTGKYGPPMSEKDDKGLLGVSNDAKWRTDGAVVHLFFNQYGDDEDDVGFLHVNYYGSMDSANL